VHSGHDGGRSERETRILRDRLAAYNREADREGDAQPDGSARMLVRVYDGGSMPSAAERVYFTHPVLVTGAETEGAAGTLTVDTETTVPVVVLRGVPAVGDYLTAYSASNRWISELGGSGTSVTTCEPCNIPNEDLTVSWTNVILGDGSATLHYTSGPSLWKSDCVDGGVIFQLQCTGTSIEFRGIFFIEGECPTGTASYCSNVRIAPLKLTLVSTTCTPFSATFSVDGTNCPTLFGDGNTTFVISL
jgi:hypothetical protein